MNKTYGISQVKENSFLTNMLCKQTFILCTFHSVEHEE